MAAKKKNDTVKWVVAIVFVLLAGVAIYLISVEKQKTKQRQLDYDLAALQVSAQSENERKLDACLANAEVNYRNLWKINCENLGSYIKKNEEGEIKSCSLPSDLAKSLTDKLQTEKDNCFKRYQ